MSKENEMIVARLNEVVGHLGIPPLQVAQRLHMDSSNLYKILNGKSKRISRHLLYLIEKEFDLFPGWLETGEGQWDDIDQLYCLRQKIIQQIHKMTEEELKVTEEYLKDMVKKRGKK